MKAEQEFLRFSVEKLRQLNSRISACLEKLAADQVWSRGGENANAVGNLCLHLAGNVRQWILHGIGGREDVRVRDMEFSARGGKSPQELQALLAESVEAAARVIERLRPEDLLRETRIQNYGVTVLAAVYSVVEHFAQHTGQIIFATKLITGEDLGFYSHLGHGKVQAQPEQKLP